MLKSCVAYTVLPASDLSRATAWYRDILELEPDETGEGRVWYRTGSDSMILVYETSNAGTAKNTAMCWLVPDIAAAMSHLRDRGVVFHEYDFPELTTVDGVVTDDQGQVAWFQDSEGNYLCLSQRA
jgi:catechol-2,3-dioxygenase